MREPIEKHALMKISELAQSLRTLASLAIDDLGTNNDAAAATIVSIRELSGLVGWTAERYGAGVFGADSFLMTEFEWDRLKASDPCESRGEHLPLEASQ